MFRIYYERNKATSTIILINVMMALVVILSGGFNLLNLISWGALSPYFVFENSEWYRLITSMVLHGSIFHLIMNMYVLFYLGAFMEKILGKIKFLILYLISGLISSLTVVFIGSPNVVTVGASGSIFGIMGALFIMTFMKNNFLNIQTIKSIRYLTFINIFFTLLIPSISVEGHLGGLISGLIIYFLFSIQKAK